MYISKQLKKYKYILFIALLLLVEGVSFAGMDSDYQSAMRYIQSNNLPGQLQGSINKKSIPVKAESNPKESGYYTNPNGIGSGADIIVSEKNTVGHIIEHNALIRPKFSVNKNSPEIQTDRLIENNATSIAAGTYKDCNKKQITKIVYTNKSCMVSKPLHFSCSRILHVHVKSKTEQVSSTEDLKGREKSTGYSTGIIQFDKQNGFLTSLSMHIRDATDPWRCGRNYSLSINEKLVAHSNIRCGWGLGDMQFDVKNQSIPFENGQVKIEISGDYWRTKLSGTITGTATILTKTIKHDFADDWSTTCGSEFSQCQKNTTCIEPSSTKVVAGVPVTRECWQYHDQYNCGNNIDAASNCDSMYTKGCTQISSECSDQVHGICDQYKQIWSCPDKKVVGQGIACGSNFYCMDGNCQTTKHEQNKDFGKSISRLAAAASAASDVKNQEKKANQNIPVPNVKIFAGHEGECRVDVVGFEDCCSNTGWGDGVLAHCSGPEKALGKAKEKGVVVATGSYCKHHFLWMCTEHRKTYCIFPSKLALDVQLYGRKNQLGRDFGNGSSTNCSGISSAEIQKIDFSKIDFSNVTQDIKDRKNLPDFQKIEKEIANRISKKTQQENPSAYSKGGL